MKILGIDPGTATTGFGLINYNKGKFDFLDCGCILTKAGLPLAERLNIIAQDLQKLIKGMKPDEVAVEELFFFNNAKTALAVGHARGVILQILAEHGLEPKEYTPLQIKQAITGYGKADKAQVQKMVKTILNLNYIPKPDDAADGLAIAITHAQSRKLAQNSKVKAQR